MKIVSKVAAVAIGLAAGQQAGTSQEGGPSVPLKQCTKSGGCKDSQTTAVLDSNWRWVHNLGGYTNCYTGNQWDASLCPDPQSCAKNCALEGVSSDQYVSTYGIVSEQGGLRLKFKTGTNVGSRVYLLDDAADNANQYKVFKLLNREFTFDVDASTLPCGINGALYFVEMDAAGSMGGGNAAGAKYGTGYCDAQCPHDIKFINGEANLLGWNSSSADIGTGRYGSCCTELDIWEANKMAEAYTAHPCKLSGQKRCDGIECGDTDAGHRYDGVCDKDGCDFNPFRLGAKDFYGEGSSFQVDSSKPFTVVTQFVTSDGTDNGDLIEIRRLFRQSGKTIQNPKASILGAQAGDSVKDDFCDAQKTAFANPNDFSEKGGLKAMGESLKRGLVIVMSLWDDGAVDMLWLDSNYPTDKDPSVPGVARGTCPPGETNTPAYVRQHFPTASVHFSNLAVGEIGSTLGDMQEVVV